MKSELITERTQKILWIIGWVACALSIACVVVPIDMHMECLILKYTGWHCPACGITRAIQTLRRGEFVLSLIYHPACLVGLVWLWLFELSNLAEYIFHVKAGMKFRMWWLYLFLSLFALNFILKNIQL